MLLTSAKGQRFLATLISLIGNLLSQRAACDLQICCIQFAQCQPNVCNAKTGEHQTQTGSLQQSRCLFSTIFLHLHGFTVSAPFRALAQDGVLTSRLDDFGRWRDLAGKIKDAPSVGVQDVGITGKYAPANCQPGWHLRAKTAQFWHFQRRRLLSGPNLW
ncbi:hypothetical protein [Cupriavidus pauculus]|uniref:hypothetical protein n=1 Tax=Cupriavidus pauculus TaxID=82633 RepID=UPI0030FBD8D7